MELKMVQIAEYELDDLRAQVHAAEERAAKAEAALVDLGARFAREEADCKAAEIREAENEREAEHWKEDSGTWEERAAKAEAGLAGVVAGLENTALVAARRLADMERVRADAAEAALAEAREVLRRQTEPLADEDAEERMLAETYAAIRRILSVPGPERGRLLLAVARAAMARDDGPAPHEHDREGTDFGPDGVEDACMECSRQRRALREAEETACAALRALDSAGGEREDG